MSASSDQDCLIRAGSNTRSNKRSALANANRDVISNLPDCVISHILSGLPSREAVRTSVLSKAWEFKWTSIYNIDVEEEGVASKSFVMFVDRLLTHSQYTKSFRLVCSDGCDYNHVKNWISSVFVRNVESVIIQCSGLFDPIVLPRSLVSRSSLKKLRITDTFCALEVPVPARICFPNLTSLRLDWVDILTESETVMFNLPVLKICELTCFWPPKIKYVEIYAPALTSFLSCPPNIEENQNYDQHGNYTIMIVSGKLAHFKVQGYFLENFILTGSQVVTATLQEDGYEDEMFVKCELRYRRLLNEFSSIEELNLSCLVAQAIAQTKWGLPLRKYDKLVRLNLFGSCLRGNHHATYDALLELLHAAPYLKFLNVSVKAVLKFSEDGAYDFDAVVSVPSCIISHLEEVTLIGLKADERHLDLAKFLLKNGSKLKKVSFYVLDAKLEEVLPKLPKGSPCLSIVTKAVFGLIEIKFI